MIFKYPKRTFDTFCQATTIHGFLEVNKSKHVGSKITWALIIIVATAVTAYQVYGAVLQYAENPTDTVITTPMDNHMTYPPLRLCYSNWMSWLDAAKVSRLNYSKDVIMYALSYVSDVYSEIPLEVEILNPQLEQALEDNNSTTLSHFLKSLARKVPINKGEGIENHITTEFFFNDATCLCYTLSGNAIYRYFKTGPESSGGKQFITFQVLNENFNTSATNISEFVSAEEYVFNSNNLSVPDALPAISAELLQRNLPAGLLYPNGFDLKEVPILAEVDKFVITFSVAVFTWKNTKSAPCLEDQRSIGRDDSCELECLTEAKRKSCSCLYLSEEVPETEIVSLCRNLVVFANVTGEMSMINRTQRTCSEGLREACGSCKHACQKWNYEFSVLQTTASQLLSRLGTKGDTYVTVEYSSRNSIVVMTEKDSLSWENFVGNVGGLLGIWTGASILSVFQMIYLCCFASDKQ